MTSDDLRNALPDTCPACDARSTGYSEGEGLSLTTEPGEMLAKRYYACGAIIRAYEFPDLSSAAFPGGIVFYDNRIRRTVESGCKSAVRSALDPSPAPAADDLESEIQYQNAGR